MSFPRYERYKDSGVEWLGEIPEHWGLNKLKYLAKLRLSNIDKHSRSNETPVSLCNYTDVYYQDLITEDLDFMLATASEEQIKKFSLERGDILITKDSETPDDIAVPAYIPKSLPGVVCGYHLAYIKPSQIQGKYLFYAFKAINFVSQFHIAATGITRYGIGKDDIGNALFLVPPIAEQERIAEFLDRKCGEIDEAIAKKQRLIELLDEQKTILINQAVTKGLNPDAPMKDSAIDWLGQIPAHWEIKRLKNLSSFLTSGPRGWSDYLCDEGSIFLQSGNLNNYMGIELDTANRIIPPKSAEAKRTLLQDGDLLICATGANTGRVALASLNNEEVFINQHLCLVRLIKTIEKKYVAFFLYSYTGNTYFKLCQYGLKQGLGFKDINDAPILEPPITEQGEIIAFIEQQLEKYQTTKMKLHEQIDKLTELKQIFIAEAVTGKIKV